MTHANPRRAWIVLGLVSACALAFTPSTRGQGSGVQAFTGATLIDGAGARIENAVLIVRDRDPLQDIRNTRTISGVWIAGNAVKR